MVKKESRTHKRVSRGHVTNINGDQDHPPSYLPFPHFKELPNPIGNPIGGGIEYKNPDGKISHPIELLEYPEYVSKYMKDGKWIVLDGRIASEMEAFNALSSLYPDLTNHYILYKHMKGMGFKTKSTQNITPISFQFLSDDEIRDVDFIFMPADSHDTIQKYIDVIDDLNTSVPVYDRRKMDNNGEFINNQWGRSFVVGIISESGKVYPIRIQEMEADLIHPLRLQRAKNIPETKNLKRRLNRPRTPKRNYVPADL